MRNKLPTPVKTNNQKEKDRMFPVNGREEDSDGVKLKGRAHIAADIIKVTKEGAKYFYNYVNK